MTANTSIEIVHHLLQDPATDLKPACGALPGPSDRGWWNACHDLEDLLECLDFGLTCCEPCLSTEALGGWSPLIPEHVIDDEV